MSKAYLEPSEVQTLEDAAKSFRDKLLVRLLFHSGARISEVLSLDVKNIDFSQGTVTILHLKSRIKLQCSDCGVRLGRNHVFCPKCGVKVNNAIAKEKEHRRMRTIPLDERTLKMFFSFAIALFTFTPHLGQKTSFLPTRYAAIRALQFNYQLKM